MTRTSLTAKLMLCGLLAACGASEEQAPGVPPDPAAVPSPMRHVDVVSGERSNPYSSTSVGTINSSCQGMYV